MLPGWSHGHRSARVVRGQLGEFVVGIFRRLLLLRCRFGTFRGLGLPFLFLFLLLLGVHAGEPDEAAEREGADRVDRLTPLDFEKPVQLFYMGVNRWRSETDWPLPGTEYREMYISSNGSANSVRGDGSLSFTKPVKKASDTYRYDPLNPVPTTGGNNCCGTPTAAGPVDQRPVERREDVLVYTSEFLKDTLTIAGPVKMKLFAATDGKDTDWMIKLTDVYPDGYSMPISEGILRARFREGIDKIRLLTPNQVYEYDIELTGTANAFLPGHRIRIDITSSNFPQFDRNPNTGDPLGSSAVTRVAVQTIHHGGTNLSHVLLPVVKGVK